MTNQKAAIGSPRLKSWENVTSPKENLTEKEKRKINVLKLLSINSRLSLSDISEQLKLPKPSLYNLLNELIEEYGMVFVPEINIPNIWKYELIRLSKSHSKKEMLHEAVEKMSSIGFEEYFIMFKFLKKKPGDGEIMKAVAGSYIPQFIAKLNGEYDLMIYAVAQNYSKAASFAISFCDALSKYDATTMLYKISKSDGYFPMTDELIKQFNISTTYQKLLIELNKNGRSKFGDLSYNSRIPQQQLTYAFERLVRSGIISRITYYESKPKNSFHYVISLRTVNISEYIKTRDNWQIDIINDCASKHAEYTFVCDVTSPFGAYVIASFANKADFSAFYSKLKKRVGGMKISYMEMRSILFGNLGIRDFDMRYSINYQYLERKKKVPRFTPKSKIMYDIGGDEEAVGAAVPNEGDTLI